MIFKCKCPCCDAELELAFQEKGKHEVPENSYEQVRTFLYIAEGDGLFKIGYSRNPRIRIYSLQSGAPYALRLIHKVSVLEKNASHLEKSLHDMFSEHKVHGEWFDVSGLLDEVKYAMDNIEATAW